MKKSTSRFIAASYLALSLCVLCGMPARALGDSLRNSTGPENKHILNLRGSQAALQPQPRAEKPHRDKKQKKLALAKKNKSVPTPHARPDLLAEGRSGMNDPVLNATNIRLTAIARNQPPPIFDPVLDAANTRIASLTPESALQKSAKPADKALAAKKTATKTLSLLPAPKVIPIQDPVFEAANALASLMPPSPQDSANPAGKKLALLEAGGSIKVDNPSTPKTAAKKDGAKSNVKMAKPGPAMADAKAGAKTDAKMTAPASAPVQLMPATADAKPDVKQADGKPALASPASTTVMVPFAAEAKNRDDDIPKALAAPVVNIKRAHHPDPVGENLTLAAAVTRSLSMHPEIGMAQARIKQAEAGVRSAHAGYYPQVDAQLSYGEGAPPDTSITDGTIDQIDAGLTLRQLLFDFGATNRDIDRSNRLLEAQRFNALDKIEDIALRTAQAYLKVLEQREILVIAEDYVASYERLAQLVRLNQNNGNGTLADVNRVNSRLLEAHTIYTSLEADVDNASDTFAQLVRTQPGALQKPVIFLGQDVPPTIDDAIAQIDRLNPRILALDANSSSIDADIKGKKAQGLPRLGLEVQGDWADYVNPVNTNNGDVRGLVVMKHKLFDGWARESSIDEARGKLTENELRTRNEHDNIAGDLRQSYRAISTSRLKLSVLEQAVETNRKVNELYIEQFKGGKRTLFELLDAQAALYAARRDLITNSYDEKRARYIQLRSLGHLAQSLSS